MKTRLVFLACFLLVACGGGGGGGGGGSTPTPAGLWVGSTSDNREIGCLVFPDNSVWCTYSPVDTPGFTEGFLQAQGSVSGNTFTANNARDFNIADNLVFSGSISATFTSRQTFSGTVLPSGNTFSLTYDATFETTPNVATAAGTYFGQAALIPGGVEDAGLNLQAGGSFAFASTSDGVTFCNASGVMSPRSDGNAFNTGITFGSGCLDEGQTYSGISYYDPVALQMVSMVVNSNRSVGGLFIGFQ